MATEYLMALWALLLDLGMWFVKNPDAIMGVIALVLMAAFGEWDLRKMAGTLIPQAEAELNRVGLEKRDWVVDKLYSLLPLPVRMILPRTLVNMLVQSVFNRGFAHLDKSATAAKDGSPGE